MRRHHNALEHSHVHEVQPSHSLTDAEAARGCGRRPRLAVGHEDGHDVGEAVRKLVEVQCGEGAEGGHVDKEDRLGQEAGRVPPDVPTNQRKVAAITRANGRSVAGDCR